MSGQFPTSAIISAVNISSMQQVYNSRSLSARRQARLGLGHVWQITLDFAEMSRAEFGIIYGFLLAQRGSYETFTIAIPGHYSALGAWGASPVVGSVINDNSITVSGVGSSADAIKAMDLFTIAGDQKLYMVTANAASSGGSATISFEPSLQITPSGGAAITVNNVVATVENDENSLSFTRKGTMYSGVTVKLMEALN